MKNSATYRLFSSIRAQPTLHQAGCLLRNGFPTATWVETGTYLGLTTQLFSKHADRVCSIEPEPKLFARAQNLFHGQKPVEILNGTSEDVFPVLLPRIAGNINFWLDGHYSVGITFRGKQDTPILDELACISRHIKRFGKVCVLIDDIRCFNPRMS